jgi:hypothetical protein
MPVVHARHMGVWQASGSMPMQQGYGGPGMGLQYMQPPMGVPGMMQPPYGAMPVSSCSAPLTSFALCFSIHGILASQQMQALMSKWSAPCRVWCQEASRRSPSLGQG